MLPVPRTARYSGSERPAWRMNHTGIRGAGRLRHASRNGGSAADIGGHATRARSPLPSPHGGAGRHATPGVPGPRRGITPVDRGVARPQDGGMRENDDDAPATGAEGSLADGVGETMEQG